MLVKVATLSVLLPASYIAFYFGLTEPIVSITSSIDSSLSITRSTLQSIQHLLQNGFYFPAMLILTFSVLVPLMKLATIVRVIAVFRVNRPKASRLAYHLRVFAKYQLLDVFVALFMVAFLNMEVIATRLERGFLFYFVFCLGSVVSAQMLYSLVHGPDLPAIARHLTRRLTPREPLLSQSSLEADRLISVESKKTKSLLGQIEFLFSTGSLVLGTGVAMIRPILAVSVAFEGSLVLSRNTLTLEETLVRLLTMPNTSVAVLTATGMLVMSVLIAPIGVVALAGKRPVMADYLSDWAMADVAALGLFTLLISMNSFGVIVAELPPGLFSGFWFLLMAGMSCLDLTLQCHELAVRKEAVEILSLVEVQGNGLSDLRALEEPGTVEDRVPTEGYESEEKAIELLTEEMRGDQGLIKTLGSKLSGNFIAMKAVSWGVFFALWFMQSAEKVVDLNMVNAQIRANLAGVTKALDNALPMSVGNCTAGAPSPCEGNSTSLYYNRSNMYEIEARWLSGLKSTRLENIHLSVPRAQVFAVEIEGEFGDIPLSLAIAECFTPDVWVTGKCRNIWDNTDACCGQEKGFYVLIVADCGPEFPFIRNIAVKKVKVDPIKIEESIAGFKVPLSDVTTTVEEAIQGSLGPTLNRPFIPWGEKNMTLGDLINRILLLNVGEHFSCPTPLFNHI